MTVDKLTLFILDDNIPKTPEYVEQSLYDTKMDAASLSHLVSTVEWKGQYNLKQLTSFILDSEHAHSGIIATWGFTHPSICLDEIDAGLIPDIIVYDWEYGSETNKESSNWLMEILNSTKAFVFVYSIIRNEIPPFLNKKEFDKYSSRFQLFLKGDTTSSVFSSEEFILQYILTKITKANRIKIQGVEIAFLENDYLDNPSDILFLEKIFGRAALINYLKEKGSTVSQESIEEMITNVSDRLLYDTKRNLLISPNSTLLIEKYKPEEELTYIESLKNYGLQKLIEVLEIGLVKV
ncbi:hypothetical protein ES705_24317 [subsurface metagenome]